MSDNKAAGKFRSKTEPAEIWQEYQNGLSFNSDIDLPDRVKKGENFFLGRQWEGVNAPDMDKPVFNVLKRVINYFISMLVSDNVGVSLSLFNRKQDSTVRLSLGILEDQVKQTIEVNKINKLMRAVLRDAAVDGDGCMHVFFDPDAETGYDSESGMIRAEIVDSQNIFFGNPNIHEVQDQPYIIISQRRMTQDVKEELEAEGRSADAESIKADSPADDDAAAEYSFNDKITVLTKYWKQDKHIYFTRSTQDIQIKPPTDTGMKLYPICFMSWERVKNCYHGMSAVDGLIPNQIAINKMAALAQQFIKQQAFPRVFYNENKIKSWTGGIKPVAVQGDPSGIVYTDNHNTNMSMQVNQYFENFIGYTKELMGASDAALGNINPDNTSAIIAVQQATAVPLELVKQEYYQLVEDYVRITLDQMRAFYAKRTVLTKDEAEEWQEVPFDFSILENYVLQLNVDVGASAYWSEVTSTSTLTNLMQLGMIEPVTYLESIPGQLLPQKSRVVSEMREKLEAQEAAQAAAQAAPEAQGGGQTPPEAMAAMMGGV